VKIAGRLASDVHFGGYLGVLFRGDEGFDFNSASHALCFLVWLVSVSALHLCNLLVALCSDNMFVVSRFLQALKWFDYDLVLDSKLEHVQVPKGSRCCKCGTVGETWPEKSDSEIRQKLTADPVFAALWEFACKRLDGEVAHSGHDHEVSKVATFGLRCEWPVAYVLDSTFAKHFGIVVETPGLRLKNVPVIDPEGIRRTGVVIKDQDLCATSCLCTHAHKTMQVSFCVDRCKERGQQFCGSRASCGVARAEAFYETLFSGIDHSHPFLSKDVLRS
jgi:hypothetical protein